ncbi:hypothetical protein CRM22_008671 [Opisthorchis felineus]|uniref:Uncharacterized protein n=1 Tax=Opisthorchis felineus TaxID=147828 RepID=A0A4S2LH99_OPIFE|nr:hypothetical protein CRM22_008671 [Opisthorchis felineus]
MPEMIVNRTEGSTGPQVRWLDQQQYLIETYRQLRTNLGQLEAEIEAARLRVTDWSQHRREPSRSRSLSHASISTNTSSHWSCSTFESSCTDASCLNVVTDGATTGSSCPSSCSSTCGIQLPTAVAVSLNAATLITAFLAASTNSPSQGTIQPAVGEISAPNGHNTPDRLSTGSRPRSNRSASPS